MINFGGRKLYALVIVGVLAACSPASMSPNNDNLRDAEAAAQRGDHQRAITLIRPLAEQGMPQAQYALGLAYWQGDGVAINFTEAARWFRLAAEQGYPEAQQALGIQHFLGLYIPRDVGEGIRWLRLAGEQGMVEAQFTLASAYLRGNAVAADGPEALRWYRRAAAAGHFGAQHDLGLLLANGGSTATERVEGHVWLSLALQARPDLSRFAREILINARQTLASRMAPSELAEAERRAANWKPVAR